MISCQDKKLVLEAYWKLCMILVLGVYQEYQKTPHHINKQEEAKFRALVEGLKPPSIGQRLTMTMNQIVWDNLKDDN